MKKLSVFLALFVSVLLPLMTGCGKRPKELPKCYPCSILLLKGGDVVPDSLITLIPTSSGKKFVSSGKVDSEGLAVISTQCGNYRENGVPEGEYKIVVTAPRKPPEEMDRETFRSMSDEERWKLSQAEKEEVRDSSPVPELFRSVADSPVTVTVKSDGDNMTEIDMADY